MEPDDFSSLPFSLPAGPEHLAAARHQGSSGEGIFSKVISQGTFSTHGRRKYAVEGVYTDSAVVDMI